MYIRVHVELCRERERERERERGRKEGIGYILGALGPVLMKFIPEDSKKRIPVFKGRSCKPGSYLQNLTMGKTACTMNPPVFQRNVTKCSYFSWLLSLLSFMVHKKGLQQRGLQQTRLHGDYRTTDPPVADPIGES